VIYEPACALHVHGKIKFWVCLPGVFGEPLPPLRLALKTCASKSPTLVRRETRRGWRSRRRTHRFSQKKSKTVANTVACQARIGTRAAIGTCATVARPRPTSKVAVSHRKCVFRRRRRSHVRYARVVEWRVLIGWRVSEERCGESNSQRLLSNRSRARKRRRICCLDEELGALRVHFQITFLVCFPGVFGAPLTPACLARLGARAAVRTCATVARPHLTSKANVSH